MRDSITRLAVLFGCIGYGLGAQARLPEVPVTTPAGVLLVDVIGFDGRFLWRYEATDHGKPLYTLDADGSSGKSSCTDDCTKEFVPYLAYDTAKPTGEWSLVSRGAKDKQWAYKGRPLYYFSGKDPVPVNPNAGESFNIVNSPYKFDQRILDPGSDFFSPKSGWRRARFEPDTVAVPAGIKLESSPVASGYVFVDASTGMPLYVLPGSPKNPQAWLPMYAPDLAGPVGDFSVVVAASGRKQWAYKKSPLYSCKDDYSTDDFSGLLKEKDARPALAYQGFMPSAVQIKSVEFRGPLLMTVQGKTLYTQALGGGRSSSEKRGETSPAYAAGKALGTKGCVDDCLKTWQPLVATDRDKPSGFWEIVDRADGTKQWAYKGSALYTYAGDKKEGDVEGNGQRVIVYGAKDGSNYDLVSLAGGNRGPNVHVFAGSGFNWRRVGLAD